MTMLTPNQILQYARVQMASEALFKADARPQTSTTNLIAPGDT